LLISLARDRELSPLVTKGKGTVISDLGAVVLTPERATSSARWLGRLGQSQCIVL